MTRSEKIFMQTMLRRGLALEYTGTRRKMFPLKGGGPHFYTPDFFDPKSSDYYEVKTSRGAYTSSALTFAKFREQYPTLTLHCMAPDGHDWIVEAAERMKPKPRLLAYERGRRDAWEMALERVFQLDPTGELLPQIMGMFRKFLERDECGIPMARFKGADGEHS